MIAYARPGLTTRFADRAIATRLTPLEGAAWLAAGVKFTSFSLIHGQAILYCVFSPWFELGLLASAALDLGDLAHVELALLGRFTTENNDPNLLVMAGLTDNSWLFGEACRLFGGFALAQGFDPLGLTMNTVFGKFHQMLATMLLFASGGYLLVIGGLLRTFHFLPIGTSPDIAKPTDLLVTAMGMFFTVAVQIALPMIAVLFIADLGLALLTKVAPSMNAINVMFPAKIGLTLLLVGLAFPVLPEAVDRLVDLANEAMATIAGAP